MVGALFKDYRPLKFFSLVALLFFIVGMALGLPVIHEFAATGVVPRFPTAILAAAFSMPWRSRIAGSGSLRSTGHFPIPMQARPIDRGGQSNFNPETIGTRSHRYGLPVIFNLIYALPKIAPYVCYNIYS